MPGLMLTPPDLDITQVLIILEIEDALRDPGRWPSEAPARRPPATPPRQRTAIRKPISGHAVWRCPHRNSQVDTRAVPATQRSPPRH
ncbi:hypothetical protein GCM10023094_23570 [Rhodococcus olei]|uniref:Uncharacterized protein n=1 Tax=Rhodococcus olei TaxID=2161675 RepID=A0ABP8P165_9NOCA